MKTSIVAVVAASLFLVAAYMGLGSGPGTPPGAPQIIALSGASSNAASPIVSDLPSVVPGSPAGPSQVLAVGRQVQQGSLKDSSSRLATTGGPADVAAGPPTTPGQQVNATVNTDIVSVPGSAPAATAPPGSVGNPGPVPVPIPSTVPTRRPRPGLAQERR